MKYPARSFSQVENWAIDGLWEKTDRDGFLSRFRQLNDGHSRQHLGDTCGESLRDKQRGTRPYTEE